MVIRCERWFGKCWLLQAGGIGGVGRWGIDVSNRPYQLPSKTCKGGESKWRMLGARVRLECTAIMNTVHSLKGITCLLEQRMNSWGPPPPLPAPPTGGLLAVIPLLKSSVSLFNYRSRVSLVENSMICFIAGPGAILAWWHSFFCHHPSSVWYLWCYWRQSWYCRWQPAQYSFCIHW